MWFDDDDISVRRLFAGKRNRRRASVLRVRVGGRRARSVSRIAVLVLVPTVVIAAGTLLWVGLSLAAGGLFSRNEKYTIKNLNIRPGMVITRELIKEYTGIDEGMNLFGFNIAKIRSEFLRHTPNVREIEMTRQLPDTFTIEVVERAPLARIGRRGYLVADREGFIFSLRKSADSLPFIAGYNAAKLRPGAVIGAPALAALQVLNACDNPRLGVSIQAVDVGHDDHLVLYLADRRTVRFAWKGMNEDTKSSRKALLGKLGKMKEALESEDGRRRMVSTLDFTIDGRPYGE